MVLRQRARFWFWTICFIFIFFYQKIAHVNLEYIRFTFFLYILGIWTGHLISLPVSGLLILGAIPLLGLMSAHETFSSFGNPVVFFLISILIISEALNKTALVEKFSFFLMRTGQKSPYRLIFILTVGAGFLTWVIPEHATAALLLPMVLRIGRGTHRKLPPEYISLLVLAVTWGSIIGGITTLVGGARSILGIELTSQYALTLGSRFHFTFFDWMRASLFVFFGILPVILISLYFEYRKCEKRYGDIVIEPFTKPAQEGWTRDQVITLVLYSCTFIAWILWGHELGLAVIATISAILFFGVGILDWESVQKGVNWGIVFLFGGAIVLGKTIESSPLLHTWLQSLASNYPIPGSLLLILFALISLILTEVISNTATVSLLLPLALPVGHSFHLPLEAIMLSITLPAGLCYLLPTGTPPTAMALATGYIQPWDLIRTGWRLSLWTGAWVILWLLVWVL